MTSTRRPTKAETKRARAEAARAALARAQRRSHTIRLAAWSTAVLVAAALVVVAIVVLNRPHTPPTAAAAPNTPVNGSGAAASAQGRTSNPPWDTPADTSAAVAAAGLPMLGEEGNAVHIHAHLDIIINGAPVQIPANIGIDEVRQRISPLHSHDTTGVIHIESPTAPATFTLGQFFTEWKIRLSGTCLNDVCATPDKTWRFSVNGKPYTGDPTAIQLAAHQEIAAVYGALPGGTAPPDHYDFPAGL